MKRSGIKVSILLLVMFSCAVPRSSYQFDRSILLEAEFGQVWDAVIDVFGEQNWIIETIERESGIISTSWFLLTDSDHIDCGGAGLFAGYINHQGRFNVIVREVSNGTKLKVNTKWRALKKSSLFGDDEWVDCVSKGTIENRIQNTVKERI